MSTSDVLSLCSLLVSLFAFAVALLTFVYTVFTRPSVKMLFGGYVWFFYSFNKKLVMQIDLAYFNSGAQPGALTEFTGTLLLPDKSEKALHSTGFAEGKSSPDSLPQTIIVPGRGVGGAGTKSIFFITKDPFEIELTGPYVVELQALIGPSLTRWCTTRAIFHIVQEPGIKEDMSFLDMYTREDTNGRARAALQMQRSAFTKRSGMWGFFSQRTQIFTSVKQTLPEADSKTDS